jgi:hypothetical protein
LEVLQKELLQVQKNALYSQKGVVFADKINGQRLIQQVENYGPKMTVTSRKFMLIMEPDPEPTLVFGVMIAVFLNLATVGCLDTMQFMVTLNQTMVNFTAHTPIQLSQNQLDSLLDGMIVEVVVTEMDLCGYQDAQLDMLL